MFHRWATTFLALHSGRTPEQAALLGAICDHVDHVTSPEVHTLQTQAAGVDAFNPQIQATVILPFHFVPGPRYVSETPEDPWVVTPANWRVEALIKRALNHNVYALGIALHAYQDSWSHAGWQGWTDGVHVGHLWAGNSPDVLGEWTDPRTGAEIDNYGVFMMAVNATWRVLNDAPVPQRVVEVLDHAFRTRDDDAATEILREEMGHLPEITIRPAKFNRAAHLHLGAYLGMVG